MILILKNDNSLYACGNINGSGREIGYTKFEQFFPNVKKFSLGRSHVAIITNSNEVVMFGKSKDNHFKKEEAFSEEYPQFFK
jgi:alpha-tubulin suppressor-like RCC1 family protein